MRSRYAIIWMVCGLAALGWRMTAWADPAVMTFELESTTRQTRYGPFRYQPNAVIAVPPGRYRLEIVSGRSFRCINPATKISYGVYEFVPGRIIDIGDMLFTIVNIKSRPRLMAPGSRKTPDRSGMAAYLRGMAIGLEFDLLSHTDYDWDIDGASGAAPESIDRNAATFRFRKQVLTARFGLVTAAEWDHTIAGDGATFEQVTLEAGTGWFAGVGMDVPVFREGYWSASLSGEAFYRHEEMTLQYGAWEVESIESTTVTNSGSNVVTMTTHYDYVDHDEEATLTETLVILDARLAYKPPAWCLYGGLKALAWADTSLDATIQVEDRRHDIRFERTDSVMGYGGAGFVFAGIRAYVEAEGGGETALRIGLSKAW